MHTEEYLENPLFCLLYFVFCIYTLSICLTQPQHLHLLQKGNILDFMVSKATSWMSLPTEKKKSLSILTEVVSYFSVMIAKNLSKLIDQTRKKWNLPASLVKAEKFPTEQRKVSKNTIRGYLLSRYRHSNQASLRVRGGIYHWYLIRLVLFLQKVPKSIQGTQTRFPVFSRYLFFMTLRQCVP